MKNQQQILRTETSLRQFRLLKMVEEIEDYAILLLDSEGYIDTWNKGAQKIKGYNAEEIIGKHFRTFYTPEDQAIHLPEAMLKEAARNGKATIEGWRVRKNGSRFWGSILLTAIHDEAGEIVGYTKVTLDLTDAKLNRAALQKSEERYHKMIDEVQDYAILLLDTEGRIMNWNKGAEKIKGYAIGEILGQSFKIFYTPEDQASMLPDTLLEQARQNGRVQNDGWRVRKSGTRFWASVVLTALHDDHNNIIGFAKVTRDLTISMLAEQAIKEKARELETKNEELEQFTYIASHDLQEPLRTVTSFTELLHKRYNEQLDNDARLYINFILQASERMRNLIKGLLDYSRIGRQKMLVQVDLNQVAQAVLDDLGSSIAKRQAVITLGTLPIVTGYETELRMLIQNLVSNAIKFSTDTRTPEISVTAKRLENAWQIEISDNGIGIEARFIHKIFLIFQRLHGRNEYEGSGIGLAHAKKIIDLHSGDIWVHSEPGQGSIFYFTLPDKK